MKKVKTIAPDLIDYDTFEPLKGANDFQNCFAENREEVSYFRFYDGDMRFEDAVKMLNNLRLPYNIFYGVKLETEDEYINYPILFVSFGSEPDLIYEEGGTKVIDKKKIKKKNIAKDHETGILVMDEGVKKLFELYCQETEFYLIPNDDNSKQYYAIGKMKELTTAPIHKGTKGVEEVPHIPGTYRNIGYTTHIDFHEDAFSEVKKHHFTFSRHFEYNGAKYPMWAVRYMTSGAFALSLQKNSPKDVEISVPTLNNV